jgi:hypothetical protein
MPSFLVKNVQVDVDASTWQKPSLVPARLKNVSGTNSIDVGQALYMLGTLTMPNLLSPASPALFWAWLRYYLAPIAAPDLRISVDFAGLDPHQKGILSDDFGVAISTQWLGDRFGGFADIVDGRWFALQFPNLLRKKYKSKAKIGQSKAPDFVMCDLQGRWHVLECKGTQTSRAFQRQSLKVAVVQKRAIQLVGSIKGEQLAAALYIANAQDQDRTGLKVIDPEHPPLIRLTENRAGEMRTKAHRLATARALGTIGLSEIAIELSLPPDIDPESELLRPSEALRLSSSRDARYTRASEQARERDLVQFGDGHRGYEGREVRLEMPPTAALPFRSVTVRQGVASNLIQELSALGTPIDDNVDARIGNFTHNARIVIESDEGHMALRYGNVLFSGLK